MDDCPVFPLSLIHTVSLVFSFRRRAPVASPYVMIICPNAEKTLKIFPWKCKQILNECRNSGAVFTKKEIFS
jgi:hypothetical protein